MQSNYKRLGDYIRQVDVRNRDMSVTTLLGLSIAKQFIPSIANIIGTDMGSYKIVKPRQFGYVPVTSRNGEKITIALYEGTAPCIISQAYIVFEVVDSEILLPEFLMMWFRRPEFDRYARFKSHGSAREVFEWEEMCEVMLPVPPIEEQRKIVAEYQAVERRIENNRRLIATLEATAQTIYRQMFVDNIDPNNLPKGWREGTLKEFIELKNGYAFKSEDFCSKGKYKLVTISNVQHGHFLNKGFTCLEYLPNNLPPYCILSHGDILFSLTGTTSKDLGRCCIALGENLLLNQRLSLVQSEFKWFSYCFLRMEDNRSKLAELSGGTAQQNLSPIKAEDCIFTFPPKDDICDFEQIVTPIFTLIKSLEQESEIEDSILSLFLSNLSNI